MIKENTYIKKDTFENWNKAKNFIPKENEIIIYTDNNGIKIGDGKTLINNLPFLNLYFYTLNEEVLEIKEK